MKAKTREPEFSCRHSEFFIAAWTKPGRGDEGSRAIVLLAHLSCKERAKAFSLLVRCC